MDQLTSSSDIATGKNTSFTSNILSSISSLLGSNAETGGMFASLLDAEPNTPIPTMPANTTSPSAPQDASANSDDNGTDGDQSSSGALRKAVSGLHQLINRITRYENTANASSSDASNGSASATSQTSSAAATGSTTSATTTTATAAASSSTATTASASTTASVSTTTATDDAVTVDLKKVVADLTALMKQMEKQLQDAEAASSAASSSSATDSSTSSAADPLSQLLAAMQALQQKLTAAVDAGFGAASSATSVSATTQSETSPASSALEEMGQLQKDLKNLMASLLDAGANNSTGNAASDAPSTAAATTADTLSQASGSVSADNTTTAPRQSLASQDSLFNMFGGIFNNAPSATPLTTSFTPVTPTVTAAASGSGNANAGGTSDGSSDADSGSQGLSTLSANLTALTNQGGGSRAVDPYAFANQLSALRATNGGSVGLPDTVEQVILQMNRGVKDGNDQMTIQLHPADMGKINIKLDISMDGQVHGTVIADNASTLSLLHKDSRSLERALQDAGLRADPGSLQFNLSGDQSGNAQNPYANNSGANAQSNTSATSDDNASGTALALSSTSDETYYITPGRVNLKV